MEELYLCIRENLLVLSAPKPTLASPMSLQLLGSKVFIVVTSYLIGCNTIKNAHIRSNIRKSLLMAPVPARTASTRTLQTKSE
jgi:hypothetical protein